MKETPRILLILCAKLLLCPLCFFFLSLLPEWLWSVCLKSGRLWTVSHSSKSVKQNMEQKGMVWLSPLTRKNKETTALTLKEWGIFFHNIHRRHDNLSYYMSERSEITLTLHCSAKRWVIINVVRTPAFAFFLTISNFFTIQDKDTYGGSFLYHLEEDTPLVAVGFVVGYTFMYGWSLNMP